MGAGITTQMKIEATPPWKELIKIDILNNDNVCKIEQMIWTKYRWAGFIFEAVKLSAAAIC